MYAENFYGHLKSKMYSEIPHEQEKYLCLLHLAGLSNPRYDICAVTILGLLPKWHYTELQVRFRALSKLFNG